MINTNLERQIVSFFKSKKVSYFLDRPYLHFHCFYCHLEATMDLHTGSWNCSGGDAGTLFELLALKPQVGIEIFNPRKKKNELLSKIRRLIDNNSRNVSPLKDDKTAPLREILEMTEELLDYFL